MSGSASGSASRSRSGREASVSEAVRAIERVRRRTYEDREGTEHMRVDEDGYLMKAAEMELPGFREELPGCGDPLEFFCDSCLEKHPVGRTCKRSTCQRCASAWCRRRAENAVAYLKALRHQRYRETGRDQYYHHVIIRPANGWSPASKEPVERTWQVVKEIADEMEMRGYGAFHSHSGGDAFENDLGEWKDRLFSGRSKEDVMGELEVDPHFHLVVVGDFVKGQQFTKRVEDETGWVIRRIADEESKRSIDGFESLAAVTTYCLSHTALRETENGNMSAQWRNIGFRESDVDVYESTKAEARSVVRKVASRTLGIPSMKLTCDGEKEVEVAADRDEQDADRDLGGDRLVEEAEAVEAPAGCGSSDVADDRDLGGRAGDLGGGTSGDFSGQMTPTGELRKERRERSKGGAGGSGGLPVVSDGDEQTPSERRRERAEELRESGGTASRTVECGGSLRPIWKAPQYYSDKGRPREARRRLFEVYREACEREDFGPEPPDGPPESLR